jgi:hypothetical protein
MKNRLFRNRLSHDPRNQKLFLSSILMPSKNRASAPARMVIILESTRKSRWRKKYFVSIWRFKKFSSANLAGNSNFVINAGRNVLQAHVNIVDEYVDLFCQKWYLMFSLKHFGWCLDLETYPGPLWRINFTSKSLHIKIIKKVHFRKFPREVGFSKRKSLFNVFW